MDLHTRSEKHGRSAGFRVIWPRLFTAPETHALTSLLPENLLRETFSRPTFDSNLFPQTVTLTPKTVGIELLLLQMSGKLMFRCSSRKQTFSCSWTPESKQMVGLRCKQLTAEPSPPPTTMERLGRLNAFVLPQCRVYLEAAYAVTQTSSESNEQIGKPSQLTESPKLSC